MCVLCGLSAASSMTGPGPAGVSGRVDPAFAGTPLATIDWGTALDLSDGVISVAFLPAGLSIPRPDERGRIDPSEPPWTTTDWREEEIETALAALSTYATFLPVEVAVTEPASADFRLFKTEDLEIATGFMFPPAFPPNRDLQGLSGYDGRSLEGGTGPLEPGSFNFALFVHELGHGFGLDHPFESFGQSDVLPGVRGPREAGLHGLNQTVFTAMSYNDGWPEGPAGRPPTFDFGYAATPMALDIAVLQAKYGVNGTHAAGDDRYVLPAVNNRGTGYSAIWDTGGTDAIVHRGEQGARIDLSAATLRYEEGGGGFVSYVEGVFGGFTIAHGVVIENARGGAGDDALLGNGAGNVLAGGPGSDAMSGKAGADTLNGGRGEDFAGGGPGRDLVRGGPGADSLAGNDGADTLGGGAGADTLVGATGADVLAGGTGEDSLWGGGGPDTARGGAGADGIDGSTGDDVLRGGAGPDSLFGDRGDDALFGGADRDALSGDEGADFLNGGAGRDALFGHAGRDVLLGGAGVDTAAGGAGDDVVMGGAGADRIAGGGGRDAIDGGAGDDGILPGRGDDQVAGGDGADVFRVRPGDGFDLLADFAPGEDRLQLPGFGFADGAAVLALARADGPDVVLALDGRTGVRLADVALDALSPGDFLV